MATDYENERVQFVGLLAEMAGIDPNRLTRTDLEEFSFASLLPTLETIKRYFTLSSTMPWDGVPPQTISQLTGIVGGLKTQIASVQTFSALKSPGGSPQQSRDNLIRSLENSWQSCYTTMVPHLAYQLGGASASAVSAQLQQIKNEAQDWLQSVKARSGELKQQADTIAQAANNVLENVRKVAQESGVSQQASHFKVLADKYLWVSLGWLLCAITFGVSTYLYLGHLAASPPAVKAVARVATVSTTNAPPAQFTGETPMTDVPALIRTMLPRLITVTLLLTGLVFCLRNFAAMAHNQVVNRHRQAALTTFQTFVSSAADPQTKSAVLLQATQAIFLPQPTGYLKGENEIPQVNQFFDLVRGVTGKGKD